MVTDHQRGLLADFAPRGTVRDVALAWRGRYPAAQATFKIKAGVQGLHVGAQPPRPARPAQVQRIDAQAALLGRAGPRRYKRFGQAGGRQLQAGAGGQGDMRKFLEDGDEIILHARCTREGHASIGFGECRGKVVAAR